MQLQVAEKFISIEHEGASAFNVEGLYGKHLQLLVSGKKFRSVGPARSDNNVGHHASLVALIDGGLYHTDPLVAQPLVDGVTGRITSRKTDGIDLYAADAGLIE